MKRILSLALVATLAACGSGGTGGSGGSGGAGGGTTDGGKGGGGSTGGGTGGATGGGTGGGATGGGTGGGATGGGTGGGATGGGSGGGAAGGGAGGGAAGGGAGGGAAGGGAGGGAAGGGAGGGAAGGGAGGGAAGGGAGGGTAGGTGGSGGAGGTCALNAATCPANTFCYVTTVTLPNGNGECRGGPCDVVTQNCTAANTQCNYGPDGGRDCFADGTLNEGDPCGTGVAAACKKSTTCVSNLADGGSACAKFCRTGTDCSGGKVCNIVVQIPNTIERPLVCNDPPAACSILLQNCPNTAQGCYPISATASGCATAGSTAAGGACAAGNACVKGALCITSGGSNNCRTVCNTDGGTPACSTGACNALAFGQGVGACQ